MSKHHGNPVGGDQDMKVNGDLSCGPPGGGCLITLAVLAGIILAAAQGRRNP